MRSSRLRSQDASERHTTIHTKFIYWLSTPMSESYVMTVPTSFYPKLLKVFANQMNQLNHICKIKLDAKQFSVFTWLAMLNFKLWFTSVTPKCNNGAAQRLSLHSAVAHRWCWEVDSPFLSSSSGIGWSGVGSWSHSSGLVPPTSRCRKMRTENCYVLQIINEWLLYFVPCMLH